MVFTADIIPSTPGREADISTSLASMCLSHIAGIEDCLCFEAHYHGSDADRASCNSTKVPGQKLTKDLRELKTLSKTDQV